MSLRNILQDIGFNKSSHHFSYDPYRYSLTVFPQYGRLCILVMNSFSVERERSTA